MTSVSKADGSTPGEVDPTAGTVDLGKGGRGAPSGVDGGECTTKEAEDAVAECGRCGLKRSWVAVV